MAEKEEKKYVSDSEHLIREFFLNDDVTNPSGRWFVENCFQKD